MLGHHLAELPPQAERVFSAFVLEQLAVDLGLAGKFGCVAAIAVRAFQAVRVVQRVGARAEAAEDAADQRIRAQTVGAVILILALAGGKDAGNVGHLIEIHPQAAHGVMHSGEDLHGHVARVVADELFVDLQNAFELPV